MEANVKMGEKIRNIRKTQGLSLSVLAEMIGKTSSYLSQVERGLAEPSITALREISKALKVPIFYFLIDDQKHNAVVRKEDRKVLRFPGSHLTFELISPDLDHDIEMIEARLKPGASTLDKPLSHNGEEVSIVIEGKMEIAIGSEIYKLKKGDSIYYNANLPHKITSIGEDDLVFISAITPPNF
ncbi:MAG: helix-turn-helix domain-containing protein [Halanaerobiales bacterium]|nr:helix-turn-helix domain-containing protein [Halanaerobiales bacterium]